MCFPPFKLSATYSWTKLSLRILTIGYVLMFLRSSATNSWTKLSFRPLGTLLCRRGICIKVFLSFCFQWLFEYIASWCHWFPRDCDPFQLALTLSLLPLPSRGHLFHGHTYVASLLLPSPSSHSLFSFFPNFSLWSHCHRHTILWRCSSFCWSHWNEQSWLYKPSWLGHLC